MFLYNLDAIRYYVTISIYALAGMGLIYFIVYGILRNNSNYSFRGLIFFIVGGSFTLLFSTALLIDYLNNSIAKEGLFGYLLFIGINIMYTLIIGLSNLVYGKKRHQRVKMPKAKPSINRDINQFVYIIYKYQNKIILNNKNDNITGFIYQIDKKNLFKDELIEKVNTNNNIKLIDDELIEIGTCTVNGKKPNIYYCYLLEVRELPTSIENELVVDNYDIVTLDMDDFNKTVIIRCLMKDKFNIYM